MGVALRLAECLDGMTVGTLPDASREAALRCVLDLVGAAAAGAADPGTRAAVRAGVALAPQGSADIWFTGRSAGTSGALFANSAAAAALDLDDGHRMARGHPGAAVIPAVWTLVNELCARPSAADDLLVAIVAGYEAGLRMAIGRTSYAPSGAWSPYAVAAAIGKLAHARPQTIAQAFAIAAQHAPGLPGLAGIMGSDVKEGIPWGSVTGWMALQLANEGFTGPAQIFEESPSFSVDRICEGLGQAPLIGETYFKPFSACRHAHAPVDACLALAARHGVAVAEVTAVTVYTYGATFNLANATRPRTLVEAQYSVPFCVAVALLRGPAALAPMESRLLADVEVTALAERVSLVHDPVLENLFPARSPARVTIATRHESFASDMTDPRGDPHLPLSWEELEAKFRSATGKLLNPARQEEILDGVSRLREGDLAPLAAAMRAAPVAFAATRPCAPSPLTRSTAT